MKPWNSLRITSSSVKVFEARLDMERSTDQIKLQRRAASLTKRSRQRGIGYLVLRPEDVDDDGDDKNLSTTLWTVILID